MFSSCRSGNFSSCGSPRTSNLVPSRDLCSPGCGLRGPSFHSGCQVTGGEPGSSQRPRCRPRAPMLVSPCPTPFPGAMGGGSRCSYSLGSGFHSPRPLGCGVQGFPSVSPGSGFCRPPSGTSGSCQSSRHQPTCGSSVC